MTKNDQKSKIEPKLAEIQNLLKLTKFEIDRENQYAPKKLKIQN